MFSVVGCRFIYHCCTGTAWCSLLTWAETKRVRQLVIHGATISSINIMITRLVGALANSKFPSPGIFPKERWQPPRELSSSFFEIMQGLNVFLEDCETFFNLSGGIYPETTCLIQDGSTPSLFRDQEIHPLSVLKYNPCQAVLLFRAVLRNLIPIKLILGVFIRMALICHSEQVSEISQGLTDILSVLFCFLPWLDL